MTLYDPVLIIAIGYIVAVVSVNMILYYFLVILYIILYYIVGYDARGYIIVGGVAG